MKKVDINRILTDVLSVVFNNEGSNSPEDITDYVDSETILDYMLEDNDYFLIIGGFERKSYKIVRSLSHTKKVRSKEILLTPNLKSYIIRRRTKRQSVPRKF